MQRNWWMPALVASFVGLGGCYGGLSLDPQSELGSDGASGDTGESSTGGGDSDTPESACEARDPGPTTAVRRLTRFEYNNTVADLLGDETAPADRFPPEERLTGFDNDAESQSVSRLLVEQQFAAARDVAQRASADPVGLMGCEPANAGSDPCAETFIESFGARAYRRPLEPSQHDRLWNLYSAGRDEYGPQKGVQLLIEAVLQSPQFLYRLELSAGEPTGPTGAVPLDAYEMASRLSYFLWGSMPDDALFAAATEDRLRTAEEVAEQAERMLDNPKARAMVRHFHRQWLGLEGADELAKDNDAFPDFGPDIGPLLREESERFIEHVVWDEDGDLATLLTGSYTFMNQQLAEYYGVPGVTGSDFQRVELPPGERAGLLTHGSVMAVHAKMDRTHPIARGVFVRERILCDHLPPPPDGVDGSEPADLPPNPTARDILDAHRSDPSCAGCHILIDPVGLGFEHYDASGRWRDDAEGEPVNASGEIVGTDVEGPFDGATQLADKLAQSDQVRRCAVLQWFRFAHARAEHERDTCTLDWLQSQSDDSPAGIRGLLVALTQTDAFRFRPAPQD